MLRFALAISFLACTPPAPPEAPSAPIAVGHETEAPKPPFSEGSLVDVEWRGDWYPARVLEVTAEGWKIHYDGYGDDWDEVVDRSRIRERSETKVQEQEQEQEQAQ